MDVKQAGVKSITMHAKELKVQTASFNSTPAEAITLNPEAATCTVSFAAELPLGEGSLVMTFTGEHNNQMNGFYRSTYKNIKGEVFPRASVHSTSHAPPTLSV